MRKLRDRMPARIVDRALRFFATMQMHDRYAEHCGCKGRGKRLGAIAEQDQSMWPARLDGLSDQGDGSGHVVEWIRGLGQEIDLSRGFDAVSAKELRGAAEALPQVHASDPDLHVKSRVPMKSPERTA